MNDNVETPWPPHTIELAKRAISEIEQGIERDIAKVQRLKTELDKQLAALDSTPPESPAPCPQTGEVIEDEPYNGPTVSDEQGLLGMDR